MIVRTAPTILAPPDAMRAMERLESQLRRAADDLAVTLAEMRQEYEAVLRADVAEALGRVAPEAGGRCGRWMPIVGAPCGRRAGHRPSCRSRELMDAETARRHGR